MELSHILIGTVNELSSRTGAKPLIGKQVIIYWHGAETGSHGKIRVPIANKGGEKKQMIMLDYLTLDDQDRQTIFDHLDKK